MNLIAYLIPPIIAGIVVFGLMFLEAESKKKDKDQ